MDPPAPTKSMNIISALLFEMYSNQPYPEMVSTSRSNAAGAAHSTRARVILVGPQLDVAREIATHEPSPTILPQVHKTTLNKAM
jgi:hypothetical protein